MKKIFFTLFLITLNLFSQEEKKSSSYFDFSYFKGNIPLHNPDIQHLITGHPEGFSIAWNKKTYGNKEWEQLYNYPDYGVSFTYQDLKNTFLGENYGLYAHYNFYFLKRNLILRIGTGLAYATNPYDKENNFRNIAFGSKVLSSTLFMVNYKKERIFNQFGLQAGLTLIHYSNASVKSPNTSVNTIGFNLGVNYQFNDDEPEYVQPSKKEKFTQPVKFNFMLRAGINENDVNDSGQYSFYIFSAFADKRIGKRSALQLGTEVFYSNFLKEYIKYKSIAYPEDGIIGDEDYKRVGLFAGHELFINKFSIVTQLGYYIYYPVEFEGKTYIRVGLKYYLSDKLYTAVTLKSHAANAEAVELGIGFRF